MEQLNERHCADGRKQKEYLAKEEATSATVATDTIFITHIINAKEGRQIAVVNLLGMYAHA